MFLFKKKILCFFKLQYKPYGIIQWENWTALIVLKYFFLFNNSCLFLYLIDYALKYVYVFIIFTLILKWWFQILNFFIKQITEKTT